LIFLKSLFFQKRVFKQIDVANIGAIDVANIG